MSKINVFLASLLLACVSLNGQTIQHTTLNVDSLFQLLDTSLISTGILLDKVPTNIDLDRYDGTCNDCAMKPETFQQVLLDLKLASVCSQTFLDSSRERYQAYLKNHRSVPLQLANINYNRFKEYVIDSNLIDTTGGLPTEGNNKSESPYYTKRFLGLSVPLELRPQGLSFILDSNFYISNDTAKLTQVQVDLGDGQGFQTTAFGQTLIPQYGELVNPEVEIGIKLTISGQVYTTRGKVKIVTCGNTNVPNPVAPPWSNASQFQFGNLVAEETYNPNGPASGNVYVHYRSNPAPGTENMFKKPLIIVEGIDFVPFSQQNAANYQMGQFGWCALWGEDKENYPQLEKMSKLLNDYHANDYDIIMLDFKDGATDIKENAYLLQTLIKRVNEYKTPDAEANVVIGASMGGIVARYALADMEKDGTDHCTRTFLSFDSPHQGANVPLGAQFAVLFFATNSVEQFAKAQNFLYGSLSRKAARQLLKEQLYPSWETEHHNFFTELINLGYPQKCKNIAIASGSGNGNNQGYGAGTKIVEYDYTAFSLLGLEADLHIWASPGRSSDNLIFHGQIPFFNTNTNPLLMGLFSGLFQILSTSWGSESMHVYVPANFPHYDNAPGGIRQVAKEIADINTDGRGTIDALYFNQSFVPTISALDINTSDLFFNVQLAVDNGTLQTPFDEVFFPNENTFHVEATDNIPTSRGDNISFAKNMVKLGESVLNPILNSIYNYGEALNNTVTHTQVLHGGKLYLYGNFNDSRSGQTPPSGNTQIYRFGCGCKAEDLKVEQNGQLIIGDTPSGNKAELIISKGSSLNLRNNSTLKINEGSKLIIEPGAELIYDPGANIQLQGPNSELIIKGKLTVKANATLTFSGQGKLVLDQDIPWITGPNGQPMRDIASYLDIEPGAKLHLIGANASQKGNTLLEVRKTAVLKDADNDIFSEVRIQNGAVEIAPQAFLFTPSPITMHSAAIRCTDPSLRHGGLRIWNHSGINHLNDLRVKHGMPGLMVSGPGASGHTAIRNSEFLDNYTALHWNSGYHHITNTTFNNNVAYAIKGQNLNGRSSIINTTIHKPTGPAVSGTAIDLQGQKGSSIQINGSTIGEYSAGLNLKEIDLRAQCNVFENNLIGIQADNSVLYLNEQANNTFRNNETAHLNLLGNSPSAGIYLLEGHNLFDLPLSNNALFEHVRASFDCNAPHSDYQSSGFLDFNYNQFQSSLTRTMASYFDLTVSDCSNPNILYPLNIDVSQNNSTGPNCNLGGVLHEHPTYTNMQQLPGTSGKLNLGSVYVNTPIELAMDQALTQLSYGEFAGNDLGALNDLINILNANVSQADSNTAAYLDLAYRAMHQALNQAYQNAQLAHNEGEPNPPVAELSDVIAVVDDWLLGLSPGDSSDHAEIFQLNLDKVHAYRVAGHYAEALGILGTNNWTFDYTQSQRAAYWDCVCDIEDRFFQEEIPAEEFDYGLNQCQQSFAGFAYKRPEQALIKAERELQDKLEAFPQPTSDFLEITSTLGLEGEYQIIVRDLQGKTVLMDKLSTQRNRLELDVQSLKPGLYLLSLVQGNKTQNLKFITN